MATKTLLNQIELEELKKVFRAPTVIDGDESVALTPYRRTATDFIVQKTLQKFRQIPDWKSARPVLLGSLARAELCPKSDVDLLFLGPETAISQVLEELDQMSLRVGYRKPADESDWSVGVEFKDILSILHAKAEFDEDKPLVEQQIEKLFMKPQMTLKAILDERKQRNERYGGALHFLEPNIKYAPGGLRDIYQGEVIRKLFPGTREEHSQQVLDYYKDFFLMVRIWNHLHSSGEVLPSALQPDCAHFFGFSNLKEFMRELQKGLGRSSFYSSLVIERSLRKAKKKIEVKSVVDSLRLLAKDQSLNAVGHVREFVVRNSKKWELESQSKSERTKIGKELRRICAAEKEATIQNLFRSRLIDLIFPELKPLIGYVQHDQYHRFTADQHILQAIRESLFIKKKPKVLGKLKVVAKDFKPKDWEIIYWTALFHDMAKGRPEDHSELGEKFAYERLTQLGVKKEMISEVEWMVKNHLALSGAAFRQNSLDPNTWHELFNKNLTPERLKRLTVFTAIDIRATNPDAWTSWKEDLLHNLFSALSEGPAESVRVLLEKIRSTKNSKNVEMLAKNLDPFLVQAFPPKILVQDILKILKVKHDDFVVLQDQQRRLWIRFFDPSDKKGLFLNYVSKLYFSGAAIHHASIHTFEDGGVYDWFCIGNTKNLSRASMEKKLTHSQSSSTQKNPDFPSVKFQEIDLVSESNEGALISFRGRDQKGALLEASRGLLNANFEILWARVHTWGRDLDDQFFVKTRHDLKTALQDLRRNLLND